MQSVFVQHLPSIFCLIAGVVLVISGFLIGAGERKFLRTCFEGRGTVVKYWSEDYHKGDRPYIRFIHEGEEIEVRSTTWLKPEDQPKPGDEVRILCRKSSVLGTEAWDVRVLKDGDAEKKSSLIIRIGNGVACLGTVAVIAGIVLLPMGH